MCDEKRSVDLITKHRAGQLRYENIKSQHLLLSTLWLVESVVKSKIKTKSIVDSLNKEKENEHQRHQIIIAVGTFVKILNFHFGYF